MKLVEAELIDGTRISMDPLTPYKSAIRWEIRDESHPTAALTGRTVQYLYAIETAKPDHEFPLGRVVRATWAEETT